MGCISSAPVEPGPSVRSLVAQSASSLGSPWVPQPASECSARSLGRSGSPAAGLLRLPGSRESPAHRLAPLVHPVHRFLPLVGSFLLVIAQLLTTTFVASLAAALMPIAAISIELLFDNRSVTLSFFIGLTLVLLGSVIILGINRIDLNFSVGLFIGLISVTFFAWGSRASVIHLPNMTTLARTTTTTLGMSGFCLIVYLISLYFELGATDVPKLNLQHVKFFIIYACFGLAISQLLWIKGVQKLGIGIASLHLNITPFYVMIILFIIGHKWIWTQAIGALIIIVGISITQIKNKIPNLINSRNR